MCEVTIFKSSFHKTKFEMAIQDFGSAKTNSKCCYLITKIPDETKSRKSTYRSKVTLLHLKLSINFIIGCKEIVPNPCSVKDTSHAIRSDLMAWLVSLTEHRYGTEISLQRKATLLHVQLSINFRHSCLCNTQT